MAKTQTTPNIINKVGIIVPKKFGVILHNDDVTTMDFVVKILKMVFRMSEPDAEAVMLKVHREGKAVAGIYSYDIAQTKAQRAMNMARKENFPLLLTVEEM